MIRRLALTAGFAILGTLSFAPNANAQTVDTGKAPSTEMIPFSGKVESSCEFNPNGGAAKPGTLKLDNGGRTLSSTVGTAGGTIIVCYGPTTGTISVGTPMKGTKTPAGDLDVMAEVKDGKGGTATSEQSTSSFEIPSDEEVNLSVDMTVTTAEKRLPAGEYSYDVPVTVTPN
ncbi:MAG: hypothetical protein MJK14_00205 [Rivularia sp. ALOHA_DT_140]|nr:hypothetical protein [Rivularia sp. ALOHA_DT_140]